MENSNLQDIFEKIEDENGNNKYGYAPGKQTKKHDPDLDYEGTEIDFYDDLEGDDWYEKLNQF